MATLVEGTYVYGEAELPTFNAKVPVVRIRDSRTQFVPVRATCLILGVDSPSQLTLIQETPKLAKGLRDIPIKTNAGWRTSACLHRPEYALWVVGIDPKRVRADLRERIEEFQTAVMQEADRLLWNPKRRVAEPKRAAVVTYTARVEIHMACLDCGAPHYIVHENDQTTVVRERLDGNLRGE